MKLQLKRPLVIFDLETTGINPSQDRIVEICLLKVFPDGREEIRTYRVNPGIPISAGAMEIHGITDADVADKPSFKELSQEFHNFLKDCDFGGFNSNKFDFPLLVEEFYRAGIEFEVDKRRFIDAQRIFHFKEPRNLKAAYKFYCDRDLENAHSAEADTVATWEILKAQLEKYEDIPHDLDGLHRMSGQNNLADLAGRLILNSSGEVLFNFGKHKGRPVKTVLKDEPGYYNWMMDGDFPQQTKNVLTRIRLSMRNDG
ncbi:MAG: 3'-5' exonuclease [Bacteroidetes bacterium]|nr:3'-5' exonuclease [Bacteroidota bacterium]